MLTVKNLLEALKDIDPDTPVGAMYDDGNPFDDCSYVTKVVEIREPLEGELNRVIIMTK